MDKQDLDLIRYQGGHVTLNDRFSLLQARQPVVVLDQDGKFMEMNQAFAMMTGFDENALKGKHIGMLDAGLHHPVYYSRMWVSVRKYGFFHGQVWCNRKDCEPVLKWLHLFSIERERPHRTYYVAMLSDLTRLQLKTMSGKSLHKETQLRLEHFARYDMLTGLPNRNFFEIEASNALRRARQQNTHVAIMFMDLNRFKLINDTFGHPFGDRLLQEVATRLQEGLQDESLFISRWGGDEFTLLAADLKRLDNVTQMAQNILQVISTPFHIDDHEIVVTPSIGISVYPDDGQTLQDLFIRADTAMYRAKEQKNTFQFYTHHLNVFTSRQYELEKDLRKAVEEREFVVYYQPQVDMKRGKLVGIEALLRWQKDDHIVSPGTFIPLAEEIGLIVQIEEWVIQTVCMQTKKWLEQGCFIPHVSVNISMSQFMQHNFGQKLMKILHETEFPPECLQLELTESMLLQDVENTAVLLKQLKGMGISIAIDDFGTGYSSLNYLKRLPIDMLKIDQTFIDEVNTSPDDAAIVEAIITMAHALNLKVVAEGVETLDQYQFLSRAGCNMAQGYMLDPPLPASVLEKRWLSQDHVRK